MEMLGDPNGAPVKGKVRFAGIATVAVNPGWRTRQGFAADIEVSTSCRFLPATPETLRQIVATDQAARTANEVTPDAHPPTVRLPPDLVTLARVRLGEVPPTVPLHIVAIPQEYVWNQDKRANPSPSVVAVLPMTDNQSLDLQSHSNGRDALALQLAASLRKANLGAQATVFEQFVRARQKDAPAVPDADAVNSFSDAYGHFGFRITPRPRAQTDPKSRSVGSGNILTSQSFPVMILFDVDQNEIRPSVCRDKNTGRWEVGEASIRMVPTTQWVALAHATLRHGVVGTPGHGHERLFDNCRKVWTELDDDIHSLEQLSRRASFQHWNGSDKETISALKQQAMVMKEQIEGKSHEQSLRLDFVLLPAASNATP
jgi:hypothetical protein